MYWVLWTLVIVLTLGLLGHRDKIKDLKLKIDDLEARIDDLESNDNEHDLDYTYDDNDEQ